jgi:hypothetical protein
MAGPFEDSLAADPSLAVKSAVSALLAPSWPYYSSSTLPSRSTGVLSTRFWSSAALKPL